MGNFNLVADYTWLGVDIILRIGIKMNKEICGRKYFDFWMDVETRWKHDVAI